MTILDCSMMQNSFLSIPRFLRYMHRSGIRTEYNRVQLILATVINFGRLFKQPILLFLLILYWFSISFVRLVLPQFQPFIKKWEMSDGLYVPLVSKH